MPNTHHTVTEWGRHEPRLVALLRCLYAACIPAACVAIACGAVACGDSQSDSLQTSAGSGGALGGAGRIGGEENLGGAPSAALGGSNATSGGGAGALMASATGGARALGGSGAVAVDGGGSGGMPQAASGGGLAGASSVNSGGAAGASGMPASAGAGDGTSGPFTLTSSAFAEGETIALKYRCRQANVSPALSWTAGPPGTRSYAVTMLHATALHWALYDIPADTRSLPEDIAKLAEPPLPAGSKQVQPNVDGSTWFGYSGPCPGGTALRSYEFFVYALSVDTLTDITTASSIDAANAAIQAKQLGRATLVGVGRASDL